MRLSPVLAAISAVTLTALLAGLGAEAAPRREPFESVQGWAVERRTGGPDAGSCSMTRTAEDAQGDTASLVIVSRDHAGLALALADRNWDFSAGERLTAPLLLDGKPAGPRTIWTGDGQILRAALPDTLVPDLLAARRLSLRFEDGEAAFDIPDIAAAYASLQRCEAARAEPPSVAAAPDLPARARLASYTVGLAVEGVLRACPVTATDRERAAVEAKMAALRPEMAAFEAAIRAQVTQSRGFACPTAEKEPEFREAMRRFIELSPDEFAAVIDRQAHAAPDMPVTKP